MGVRVEKRSNKSLKTTIPIIGGMKQQGALSIQVGSLMERYPHLTYCFHLVPEVGIEPTRTRGPEDFESSASTNFTTPALVLIIIKRDRLSIE